MRKNIILALCCIFSIAAIGQKNYTISGYIKDESNGEALLGATVYAKEIAKGAVANTYGFYSLTIPEGKYTLEYTYIGFQTRIDTILLNENKRIDAEMSPTGIGMKEVAVYADRGDDNVSSTSMGTTELKMEAVKKVPTFMGEADLMKTIQLLPGVQSSGEGSSGYYVRGGGLDHNLVLLDDAVIYNAGHLFGDRKSVV